MVKRRYFSILAKISLVILLLTVVSTGVTSYLMAIDMKKVMLEDNSRVLKTTMEEKSREIKTLLDTGQRVAFQVASNSGVVSFIAGNNSAVQGKSILTNIENFPINPEIVNIYILDSSGKVVISRDSRFLNQNYSFRSYFSKPMLGNPTVESAIGVTTNEFGIYYGVPIYVAERPVGVAVVKLVPNRIEASLEDSYMSTVGNYFFVDKNGVIIKSNRESAIYSSVGTMSNSLKESLVQSKSYPEGLLSNLHYDELQKLIEEEASWSSISVFDEEDGKQELLGLVRIENYPLYLVEEQDLDIILENIKAINRSMMFVVGISMVTSGFLTVLLIMVLLRPLGKINKFADEVASGSIKESISVKTGDEMESLTESINLMVGSLNRANVDLEEKVKSKTAELEKTLSSIEGKNMQLENSKKAVLNVMEDLNIEKERIANEKNRVETILGSIGDGVFVTDIAGKVTMVNKMALEMSGYELVETIGKHYTEVLNFRKEADQEALYPDFVKKVLDTGVAQSLANHTVIVHKNGSTLSVMDSAAPVKDVDGKVYACVVVFRNNTHERELEKSKDDFLSVTSHQLRTPLGSMRWNVEMLLGGDAGKLSEEAEAIAKQIHEGNIRMINLVNDLLNVNRIDQGKVMDEPVKTDLGMIIKEASEELAPIAEAGKVKIELKLLKVPEVLIDSKRFREVVTNLMSNSIKYNKSGGRVEITLKEEKEQAVMVVKDNGEGIPKNDIKELFTKFYRASNAVHSETEGSGLGLYVVKKFVEGWGGKIELSSVEGEGTVVTVMLPLSKLKYKANG